MVLEEVAEYCGAHPGSRLTCLGPDGRTRELGFAELQATVLALADRLAAGGLRAGHVVGLQAENAIEWVVWDLAVARLRAVLRPYPAHHHFDAAERIATDGLALLVSDRPDHLAAAHAVSLSSEDFDPAAIDVLAPRRPEPDLHSLVYSSGTTGREKVLMISRAGAVAAIRWFLTAFDFGPEDRHLVFLPLANFQQRQQVYACLFQGVNLGLCSYDRAMPATRALKPTFLVAPPALYENMLSIAESGAVLTLPQLFGGEIRFMITGMAAIRARVMDAYWAAGLKLLEGYGLTECGIIACNTPDRRRPGTVGRLLDPEAFSLSADGEILIRQRHPLSLGYLDDEALNRSIYREDGTVMTGDIGHLDEDGFLVLDGRLKEMIPLPSGKKLNPADLEQVLLQLPGVADAIAVDNGAGVTAVLNVTEQTSDLAIRTALRGVAGGGLDAAGAVNQIIFTDIPLSANPLFSTANMKLNRALVSRHFLGSGG